MKYTYDGPGTLLRKFVYGPGIDEPICLINVSSGDKYYYHYDGLGSVVALSHNNEIVESYSYDVYGKPSQISAVGNPYLFTGRAYDGETGLYYYRARYYKPSIGRFLQTDPVGYTTGLNLYAYCGSNPLNWADPLGLCKSDLRNGWQGLQGFFAGLGQAVQSFKDNVVTRAFIDPLGLISDTLHGAWNMVCNPLSTAESIFSPMWNNDPYDIGRSIGNFIGNTEIGVAITAGANSAIGEIGASTSDEIRVFWSGKGAEVAATEWAQANGAQMLDMVVNKNLSWLEAKPLWAAASKEFAEGATGEVHVFLGESVSPESIWLNDELPAIIKNPNVTNIVHHSVP